MMTRLALNGASLNKELILGDYLAKVPRLPTPKKTGTMAHITRLVGASAAGLLLLGASVTLATGAGAATPAPLTGSAPAYAHRPAQITFSYSITLADPLTSAVLTTHQDAALHADLAGVQVDGVAVPPTQVSRPDSVDIAIRTGALPTDVLAAGAHTITFLATVGTGAGAATSSSATLAGVQGVDPFTETSPPVAVQVNQPDIAVVLTPDSGEDQTGIAGTGQDLFMAVDISNAGYGTPTTSMEIDLPVGLVIGREGVSRNFDGSPLDCSADPTQPQHIICRLGTLSHAVSGADSTIVIDLTTTDSPPVGTTAPITVSAAPDAGQGTDDNPANNSVTAHIRFTGSAALSYTVTPATTTVPLGGKTTVKLTVHNSGPQAATGAVGFVMTAGDSFEITDFTGNTKPPAGYVGGIGSAGGSGYVAMGKSSSAAGKSHPLGWGSTTSGLTTAHAATAPGAVDSGTGDARPWFLGDIPSGQSASAVLTLKAVKLGTAQAQLLAFSEAGDPNCPDMSCDPTTADIEAVAVTAPVLPPVQPTPITLPPVSTVPVSTVPVSTVPVSTVPVAAVTLGGGAQPVLANTGASSTPALGLGGALLIGGATLVFFTRRRTAADVTTR